MKRLLCALLVFASPAFAVNSFYLGAQIGHIDAGGSAIGFGADLGIPTGSILDVMAHVGYSKHSGNSLFHPTLAAAAHLLRTADFDLTAEAGPGFYFSGGSTKFGINFGTAGDVLVQDQVHLGVGFRYHVLFNSPGLEHFYSIMMRVGYDFN